MEGGHRRHLCAKIRDFSQLLVESVFDVECCRATQAQLQPQARSLASKTFLFGRLPPAPFKCVYPWFLALALDNSHDEATWRRRLSCHQLPVQPSW